MANAILNIHSFNPSLILTADCVNAGTKMQVLGKKSHITIMLEY